MPKTDDPSLLFRRKSRTFSLAAKLFDARDRDAVARLYCFCRQLDDLADDTLAGESSALQQVAEDLDSRRATRNPLVSEFLQLADERTLSVKAAIHLTNALQEDCGPRQIQTENELIQFAFGVAGTVGILMCPVLGISDHRALPFAIDLGIGLQLTNIARDVVEDARRSRYYLPREWIEPSTIDQAILGSQRDVLRLDESVRALILKADLFYESGLSGHWFIPNRNRRATFLATYLYREIGHSMRRIQHAPWLKRRSLSPLEKAIASLRAVKDYRRKKRRAWSASQAPIHDQRIATLHLAAGIRANEYTLL